MEVQHNLILLSGDRGRECFFRKHRLMLGWRSRSGRQGSTVFNISITTITFTIDSRTGGDLPRRCLKREGNSQYNTKGKNK